MAKISTPEFLIFQLEDEWNNRSLTHLSSLWNKPKSLKPEAICSSGGVVA